MAGKMNSVIKKIVGDDDRDALSKYTSKVKKLGYRVVRENTPEGRIKLKTLPTNQQNRVQIEVLGVTPDDCVKQSIVALKKHANLIVTLD